MPALLQIGATGPDVLTLQSHLGVSATGTFDTATDTAVRAYQAAHGLADDGIVGDLTWASILGIQSPTTVPTAATHPSISLSGIEAALAAFVSALPIISAIFPPLRAVTPFIPLIQGIINALKDVQAAPQGDIGSVINILLKHLQDVIGALQQHKVALAVLPPPPNPS